MLGGRASAFPSSGEWNDDDFDVRADGALVGRVTAPNLKPTADVEATRILPSLNGKTARP